MMLSLDTETTGTDFNHGARPFLVTRCNDKGEIIFFEWDVDPITRQPQIPEQDIKDIILLFSLSDLVVMQNAKFDVKALYSIGITDWNWNETYDTLLAGHLLASSQPHDLTTMALVYLGINIQPYEDRLKTACEEARRMARSQFPTWRIAKAGLREMPSAKEKTWKYDTWLPRALAKELEYKEDHPWWTVTSEYANADSAVTLPLWKAQESELKKRGLWEIYLERLKLLPVVYEMERRGVTISKKRLEELKVTFTDESVTAGNICTGIAKNLGYELTLPKSGNNKSLLEFCFGKKEEGDTPLFKSGLGRSPDREKYLDLPVAGWTESGNPSLDKTAMEHYEVSLEEGSAQHRFISALRGKRKRDTAISYMESYERYMLPMNGVATDWYRLFPSLNPTGTDTLRFSSQQPNSQNISKQEDFTLRYIFGPAPGREWWSLDYENIELRIPAYESGEKVMIELFEKPDDPPYFGSYHLMNASIIYPDLFWPLAKEKGAFKKKYASTWYQYCKNFGFAVQYGAVPDSGTADRAAHKKGAHLAVINNLKKLAGLNKEKIRMAEKYGYVETLPDKTVNPKRGYPLVCTRSEYGRILPTVPLSYFVQGTAMWCTSKAMVRCADYLNRLNGEDPKGYCITMQIHDEIVFDFPKGSKRNLPKVMKLKQLMEMSGDDIGIPLKVSVAYNPNNWSKDELSSIQS